MSEAEEIGAIGDGVGDGWGCAAEADLGIYTGVAPFAWTGNLIQMEKSYLPDGLTDCGKPRWAGGCMQQALG